MNHIDQIRKRLREISQDDCRESTYQDQLDAEREELEEELTKLTTEKTSFKFCGVDLGVASGWDGDQEVLTFYDLEPSEELKEIFPEFPEGIYTISILIEEGILEVYITTNVTMRFRFKMRLC